MIRRTIATLAKDKGHVRDTQGNDAPLSIAHHHGSQLAVARRRGSIESLLDP